MHAYGSVPQFVGRYKLFQYLPYGLELRQYRILQQKGISWLLIFKLMKQDKANSSNNYVNVSNNNSNNINHLDVKASNNQTKT
jgi:hypothetical protein